VPPTMKNSQALSKYKIYSSRSRLVFDLYETMHKLGKDVIHGVVRVFDVSLNPQPLFVDQKLVVALRKELFAGEAKVERMKNTYRLHITLKSRVKKFELFLHMNGKCVVLASYFQVMNDIRELTSKVLQIMFPKSKRKLVSLYYRKIEIARSIEWDPRFLFRRYAQEGLLEGPYPFKRIEGEAYVIRGFPHPLYDILLKVYRKKGSSRWKVEAIRLCKAKRYKIRNPPFTEVRRIGSMLSSLLDIILDPSKLEEGVYRILLLQYIGAREKYSMRRLKELSKMLLLHQNLKYGKRYSREIKVLRDIGLVVVSDGIVSINRTPVAIKYLKIFSAGVPLVNRLAGQNTLVKKARELIQYYVIQKVLALLRDPKRRDRLLKRLKTILYARKLKQDAIVEVAEKELAERTNYHPNIVDETNTEKESSATRGTVEISGEAGKAFSGVKETSPRRFSRELIFRFDSYFKRVTVCYYNVKGELSCRSHLLPKSWSWSITEDFVDFVEKEVRIIRSVHGWSLLLPNDLIIPVQYIDYDVYAFFSALVFAYSIIRNKPELRKYILEGSL